MRHEICAAIAALSLPAGINAAEPAGSSPNVVLIMCDDLGWGDVGFNGNTVIRTPHLDEMAAAGMKFNRFYAAAPVCSPTRGSCLTGRHPYRYGIFHANSGHLPPQEFTLAEALKQKGYATGHFGKWHLGTLTKTVVDANRGGPRGAEHYSPPWQNGFDVCFSTESKVPTWDPMLKPNGIDRGTWWDPLADASEARPYGTYYWSNGERVADDLRGDNSRVIMDRVIPFLEGAVQKQQPFFAAVWFHTPHLPVVAGPRYTRLYSGHDKYAQHYYGCITAMDEQVGRLRRTLRELGIAEKTILFFCSDNGPEGQAGQAPGSAGPFRGRKRSLYEGGIRVPALLEWPEKVEPGRVTDFAACTSDYLPTILEAVGFQSAEMVDLVDGLSLLPLIENRLDVRPQAIAFESKGQVALSDVRYKLIHVPEARQTAEDTGTEDLRFELYDLASDPAERHDLAADHPQFVEKMAAALVRWRRSCAASRDGADDGPGR